MLKRVLLESKISEGIADVDTFISENNIADESIIQAIKLDKAIFKEKSDAVDWILSHNFYSEVIDESEDYFNFLQVDFDDLENISELELMTGVTVIFGELKPSENPLALDEKIKAIKFSSELPQVIELAKVISGTHVNYGKVEITKKMLKSFERNFNDKVVGVDIMIDFDHEQRGAAGWVKEVFLSFDESTLLGVIRWTEKGAQALSSRSFRYLSPEFTLNYKHPHTGVSHGPTLLGGGLVNRPFLKMDAIVTFNEKSKTKEVNMETIALNEHNAIKSDLEKQISDFKLSEEKAKKLIDGQKTEITKLSEELKELKEANAKAEKEAKHTKLFKEGKISKAQLDALNKGKDMYEVLSLSETMTTEPNGKNGNNSVVELSEADQKACDALGISKEDYVKYNL